MLEQWTVVPLENDEVVTRQVSTFINIVALFVNKYGLIWQELGKVEPKCFSTYLMFRDDPHKVSYGGWKKVYLSPLQYCDSVYDFTSANLL